MILLSCYQEQSPRGVGNQTLEQFFPGDLDNHWYQSSWNRKGDHTFSHRVGGPEYSQTEPFFFF